MQYNKFSRLYLSTVAGKLKVPVALMKCLPKPDNLLLKKALLPLMLSLLLILQ